MAYRISLHLLATIWNILLLMWAISLRKSHRYYSYLIPVCLFAGAFTAAWAVGLIFESEIAMRMTWIGALWPAALLFFIREMFDLKTSYAVKAAIWTMAVFSVVGGITPYCLVEVTSYNPDVVAVYGPLEPYARIGVLIQIGIILWTSLWLMLNPTIIRAWHHKVTLLGFSAYGVGALLTCSLLPLVGEYRFLESTSYGSVIWTTFAVWHVFKDLQERNRSLVELDDLKKVFISHITHEFRTPISAIASANEILSDLKTQEQKKLVDYTRMISRNADRLTVFVDELLDLAAIEQAKVQLYESEVDLHDLLMRTIDRLSPLLKKGGVSLEFDGENINYFCDEEKIEQVMTNLISNAIKAAPNGKINVQIKTSNDNVLISVTDNGIGIAREHLEHIFSSFYRVAIKSSPYKGTGLGLAISKGWVEAHGGHISAHSEGLSLGTRFVVSLPLTCKT